MTTQFIITVHADLSGRYTLTPHTFRLIATNPLVAARRAWTMYKKLPQCTRKRLDNICIKIVRAGTVD